MREDAPKSSWTKCTKQMVFIVKEDYHETQFLRRRNIKQKYRQLSAKFLNHSWPSTSCIGSIIAFLTANLSHESPIPTRIETTRRRIKWFMEKPYLKVLCVCVREREREREGGPTWEWERSQERWDGREEKRETDGRWKRETWSGWSVFLILSGL